MNIAFIAMMYAMATPAFADALDDFAKYSYQSVLKNNTLHLSAVSVEGTKQTPVQLIVTQKAKIIFTKNERQSLLFLFRVDSNSAWILSNQARRPLMISLSQKVASNFTVEDLTGIDMRENYSVETVAPDGAIVLRANSRKTAFPFISLQKITNEQFSVLHLDRNKKPIKKVLYTAKTMNGITIWGRMEVQNLVFDEPNSGYEVISIVPVNVPESYFYFQTMDRFFAIFVP